MGELSINMNHMNKWVVNSDNAFLYNKIMQTNGKLFSMTVDDYVEALNSFNIFYTLTK